MNLFKKAATIVAILPLLIIAMSVMSFGNPDKVKLAAGMPVILSLTEEVSTKTKNANETVNLEVAKNVVVDGKILIKSGTPALATVTLAQKKGMVGKAGTIQIALESTKAVDGQRVMLRATLTAGGKEETTTALAGGIICCPLFLLMQGHEAVFAIGTEIKAYTETDMMIEVP